MYNDNYESTELKLVESSYEECRRKLFEQYGETYTIVDRRPVLRGGFLGFFQKQYVEVTYIINPRLDAGRSDMRQRELAEASRQQAPALDSKSIEQLNQLSEKMDELTRNVSLMALATAQPEKHETIARIEKMLEENEFTSSYISEMSEKIRSELSASELDDFDFVQKKVVDWIGEKINITPATDYKVPHVIVIVGPTGVGKTTTVAKMAAGVILDARKSGLAVPNVRMVTIDRTRVGAEEQLRRYGEIMDIPVDKAEKPDDVQEIFEKYKSGLDTLLVDTSGYSPNDPVNIGKMQLFMQIPNFNPDVYLAVSASTKARDLENIMQKYEPFGFKSVIVTKCDETSRYGNILSVLAQRDKPISYITDGQQVPRYFEKASVVRFLTNLADFKIDRPHIDEIFRSE